MTPERLTRAALSAAGALLVACGGKDASRADSADSAAAATEAPAPPDSTPASSPSAAAEPASTPLTPEDIDRWQKGMSAELAAVHDAESRLKGAKSGEDTLSAMMAMQEMSTAGAGAKAAGVDTTMLSPAQREEMRKGNEAQLKQMEGTVPPAVVEALRPRAEELRKQSLELVGARLKAATAKTDGA